MQNIAVVHHVNQALNAHKLFRRDVDYIVKDGKVVIIDEFTGRMMEGRRYSNGQHQALEAKEKVNIENENQTLASITFQNYFRLYPKLSGMTGTAATEAAEFSEIYGLGVVEVPTHMPMIRADNDDEIYRTADEKLEAIVAQIEDCRERGQPVLVGTTSIARSEELAALLKKRKVPHHVLNARYHEQEAFIVAQAGRPGAVTIATNMADGAPTSSSAAISKCALPRSSAELRTPKSASASPKRSNARSKRGTNAPSPPAAFTSSGPNVTKAAASTTSCAVVRAARETPARRNSSSRLRTT